MPYNFLGACQIIPTLRKRRVIQSFFIRYECERCGLDDAQYHLVDRDETLKAGKFRTATCTRCKALMEPDPLDEDFIAIFRTT